MRAKPAAEAWASRSCQSDTRMPCFSKNGLLTVYPKAVTGEGRGAEQELTMVCSRLSLDLDLYEGDGTMEQHHWMFQHATVIYLCNPGFKDLEPHIQQLIYKHALPGTKVVSLTKLVIGRFRHTKESDQLEEVDILNDIDMKQFSWASASVTVGSHMQWLYVANAFNIDTLLYICQYALERIPVGMG